jgi:hypothetical protein
VWGFMRWVFVGERNGDVGEDGFGLHIAKNRKTQSDFCVKRD